MADSLVVPAPAVLFRGLVTDTATYQRLLRRLKQHAVVVLPVLTPSTKLPYKQQLSLVQESLSSWRKSTVQELLQRGHLMPHAPEHQGPTDLQRWITSQNAYQLRYNQQQPPSKTEYIAYYLALRKQVPWHDERFRSGDGTGNFGKMAHTYSLAAGGSKFLVLPNLFMMHDPAAQRPAQQKRSEQPAAMEQYLARQEMARLARAGQAVIPVVADFASCPQQDSLHAQRTYLQLRQQILQ